VLVVVGPTGSGKTGVAIEIAKALDGEIISADSRTIYRGMDVGTAKPSVEERSGVCHFGFDLVNPDERFTVADWKEYALNKIDEIRKRGHVPIIVGGTGLYIDALVYDYHFDEKSKNGALDREKIDSQFFIVGVDWDKEILRERLVKRIEQMFCSELYAETRELVDKYGWGLQAMKSNIYQFAWRYLEGEITIDEAKELAGYDDWHLAKRQLTWLRRNKQIVWLPLDKIKSYVLKCMQDE